MPFDRSDLGDADASEQDACVDPRRARDRMRILVVSDLHGNRAAIEAVEEPYDVCFCLGDLVDYGPEPAACIRWAMANVDYAVRGNHDHGVAQEVPVTGDAGFRYLTRVTRPDMWEALDADERKYLVQLPVTRRVTVGDVRFLLVHATPRDPLDEYLLRDETAWARRLEGVDADVVCVGHTHMQFKLKVGDKTVLNPGSVGLPRDGDTRAAYAIIEDGRIELKRVPYPIEETVAAIRSSPWPERAKIMLTHVVRNGRLPQPASTDETTTAADGEG
jgi:putative phosphoesterase